MFPTNTWVYDLEIVNAIPDKTGMYEPGIRYCKHWGDHAGMGVSVLVAARLDGTEKRVYIGSPVGSEVSISFYWLSAFSDLMNAADMLVSFHGRSFDAKVLAAKGIYIPERKHYDFYHEIKKSLGKLCPKGMNLESVSTRCGGPAKSGDGARCPHLWQQGRKMQVINYCLNDSDMLLAVARYYAINNGCIPDDKGEHIKLRSVAAIQIEG